MKWKILISAPYAMPVIEAYKERLSSAGCDVIVAKVNERLEEHELLPIIRDIDGIICGDDRITERVLDAAPHLKVISKWGTGIDSIDLEAAARRNVRVCNTPNAFSEPVADTVFGHMLQFARQSVRMNSDIRATRWQKPQLFSLSEKTLGVVGVGNCGKAVVRRAKAFGMRVLGNDIVPVSPEFVSATGIEMVSFPALLKQADFITAHTTLNPTSFHLFNDVAFDQMKPGAHLINTSRGPVVEEAALVRALESGKIAGAALDVFEVEPLPLDSRLRKFDNCWLSPHNANSSPLYASRVHESTIRNLLNELERRANA
jgi:D-3-phosphoglycerate dehydrogenase